MASSPRREGAPACAGLVRQLYGQGVPVGEIARRTGLSTASVYWWMDRQVAEDGTVSLAPLPRRRPPAAGSKSKAKAASTAAKARAAKAKSAKAKASRAKTSKAKASGARAARANVMHDGAMAAPAEGGRTSGGNAGAAQARPEGTLEGVRQGRAPVGAPPDGGRNEDKSFALAGMAERAGGATAPGEAGPAAIGAAPTAFARPDPNGEALDGPEGDAPEAAIAGDGGGAFPSGHPGRVPGAGKGRTRPPARTGAPRARLLARLWSTAERQVAQIEARMAAAAMDPEAAARAADAEKDARALALIARTLRELSAVEDEARARKGRPAAGPAGSTGEGARGAEGEGDGAHVRDRDAFRRELALRLDRLRAQGEGPEPSE